MREMIQLFNDGTKYDKAYVEKAVLFLEHLEEKYKFISRTSIKRRFW